MAAHVSLAAGPPVLIGDVPATIAALAERVKEVPAPVSVSFVYAHEFSRMYVPFLRSLDLKKMRKFRFSTKTKAAHV